ncbi:FAD/NAD(P)-binding domain-containing protein [Atractiella rhizophila]|nr:FAD/NAD(P)-binding domain-containing protein [Atractiella rhizophila]
MREMDVLKEFTLRIPLSTSVVAATALIVTLTYFYSASSDSKGNMTVQQQPKKNIVIVGYGPAGMGVVKDLLARKLPPEYRIVVLEKHGYAFYPIPSLRAAVQKGWEEKAIFPLPTGSSSFLPSPHLLLPSTSVERLAKDHVILSTAHPDFGIETVLPFEYCVVCTGSQYATPCRLPDEAITPEEGKEALRKLQREYEAAEEVLIVGGGPVGVEGAGEIKEKYPNKKVTLVMKEAAPLAHAFPTQTKFTSTLLTHLREVGVRVITEDRINVDGFVTGGLPRTKFVSSKGVEVTADFIFVATGTRVFKSLVSSLDENSMLPGKGALVRDTLQLDTPNGWRIFVVGDAAGVEGEMKNAGAIMKQAPFVGKNILASIKNQPLTGGYKPSAPLSVVPIGTKHGSGFLFGFTMPTFFVRKLKGEGLLVDRWLSNFK